MNSRKCCFLGVSFLNLKILNYYPPTITHWFFLLKTGLEFSKQNIEHILKSFSHTNKTSLNFSEFKTITEFLIKVKQSFLAYDTNNDGNIDKPNVSKALEEFQFKLPLDSLKKLTTLFDTDNRYVYHEHSTQRLYVSNANFMIFQRRHGISRVRVIDVVYQRSSKDIFGRR